MSARGLVRQWWEDTRESWKGAGAILWPWRPSYFRSLRDDLRAAVERNDWREVLWWLSITSLALLLWLFFFVGVPLLAVFRPGEG